MKRFWVCLTGAILAASLSSCMKPIDPSSFESPSHRVLYELMVDRCNAVGQGNMKRLRELYVSESSDLKWLSNQIDYLSRFTFQVAGIKKMTIVGSDAAAQFVVHVDPSRNPIRLVDVLYVKVGTQWKIESVNEVN